MKKKRLRVLPIVKRPIDDLKGVQSEQFKKFKDKRILIIESDILNQNLFVSLLKKFEIKPIVSDSKDKALELLLNLKDCSFDLAFIDLDMPKSLELSLLIRENRYLKGTPMIALNSSISKKDSDDIFNSGINGYFYKPITVGKIYMALEMFLGINCYNSKKILKECKMLPQKVEDNAKEVEVKRDILNYSKGLGCSNHNKVIYHFLLRDFISSYFDSYLQLVFLRSKGRDEDFLDLLIELEGITTTLGAERLYVVVKKIIRALEANLDLSPLLEEYKEELELLKSEISKRI